MIQNTCGYDLEFPHNIQALLAPVSRTRFLGTAIPYS